MPQLPPQDRLAVWTFIRAGEEVAVGHLLVTDEERAAAGRETVAGRSRELIAANRDRAASCYTQPGLPADQDMLRVWRPRDPAELRARLGDDRLVTWAEGDILHVLWHGQADRVELVGGVQAGMWPVDDADGLWEASWRIRRLDEAVISIMVLPLGLGEHWSGRTPAGRLEWRGPEAPAPPVSQPLAGTIHEHVLDSEALGAPRGVTVYLPPGPASAGPLPGCVLADGQSARGFAEVLEPAIVSGATPPVLLVGVHNGVDPARPLADRRAEEYLPGRNRRRFAAHLRFVTGEVIPWAAGQFPCRGTGWIASGYSNGGAWAIGAGLRDPGTFAGVAAFSAGVVPRRLTSQARTSRIRHYLAAGLLEPGFHDSTRRWARHLDRAGLPCRYYEWPGGHDHFWWQQQLPPALAWLLAEPRPGDPQR